jgi:GNAT superfamily N-acetyltransferase
MANTDTAAPTKHHTATPAVEILDALAPATLAMLDALVVQSGWNQTEQDWNVFFRHGSIHVIRDAQGEVVASGACLPMDDSARNSAGKKTDDAVAWISMILVAPALRGGGLGRAIFDHCLQQVLDMGRIPMLDATPQGEKIYTRFGFAPLWRLTRWTREARPAVAAAARCDKPALTALAEMDAQALGFARPDVLDALLGRDDSRCVRSELGFAIVRAGRTAHHVGPMLATSEAAAASLLLEAAHSLDGPILIDVPDDRKQLCDALVDAGFEPQRGFARMALIAPDQTLPHGQTTFIHAIAGPEFG